MAKIRLIPIIDPRRKKTEIAEKVFKVPKIFVKKGFIPTAFEQKNNKVRVEFTKFKFDIKGLRILEKKKSRDFKVPKNLKVSRAVAVQRGFPPSPRFFRLLLSRREMKKIV